MDLGKILNNVDNNLNTLGRMIGYHSTNPYNPLLQIGLLSKPLGVAIKNDIFLQILLSKNIGNNIRSFDGYGTPIGEMSDPYMNLKTVPWFIEDSDKRRYDNYLSYVNGKGKNIPFNFNGIKHQISLDEYNKTINENSVVGAVRQYDIDYGSINLNDTSLGVLNSFYLNSTLNNTLHRIQKGTSYSTPSEASFNKGKQSLSITEGSYSKFGLTGEYGLKNSASYNTSGIVKKQSLFTDDLIPWSTADHRYNSLNDLNRVSDILDSDTTTLNYMFEDETKGVPTSERYYPFGNFYSLTYSLGLITASGSKTQEFIAKSMYGYDLLSDDIPTLDFSEGDIVKHPMLTKKKYFASIGSRGSNYIDAMTSIDVGYESNDEKDLQKIRLILNDVGNDNTSVSGIYLMYSEAEGQVINTTPKLPMKTDANEGVAFGGYIAYDYQNTNKNDIIRYTNEQFQHNRYKTLIARFHTDEYESAEEARISKSQFSSAISKYGMSHGRNLLKKEHKNQTTNNYSDPYCRVWTYHKQYKSLNDTIRSFDNSGELDRSLKKYQVNREHLKKYSVLDDNGMVKIGPYDSDKVQDIKKCMFSIENLAWKNSSVKLNEGEKGPLGGRIMWFPPYGLSFNENTSANWNPTQFIGRGENIYTYVNSERSGNLSFTLLMDHPSIINSQKNAVDTIGDVDDVNSAEQSLLRFFAGCEILSSDTIKGGVKEGNVPNEVKSQSHTQPTQNVETQDIVFFVFFPNNYSGIDEVNDKNTISAIKYLLYGVGSQLMSTSTQISYSNDGKEVGGYELRDGIGISIVNNWIGKPSSSITFVDMNGVERKDVIAIESVNKDSGKLQYWGYACDKSYQGQSLNGDNNYLDTISYGLNSKNYQRVNQFYNGIDSETLYSFVDVYAALSDDIGYLNNVVDETKVKILRKLFKENKNNISNIRVEGFASSHGYEKENIKLAKNRANTIAKWLEDCFSKEITPITGGVPKSLKNKNVNSLDGKLSRCCKVVISISKVEVIERNYDNINYYDNLIYRQMENSKDGVTSKDIEMTTADTVTSMAIENILEKNKKVKNILEKIKNSIKTSNDGELSTEYEYFKKLEKEQPFLHHKLVDKIKYFDPAFHSITPEGFQARLTFLNQCTRQGETMSSSDVYQITNNAYNLSFGAPPICVLRIGDFYDTKIIIDNLQINFDEASWDLNEEGIGVMPMMANISLGFKFIGGSDLGGPISKLQNAVSFNYYANTKVYDDRADKVEYRNGKPIYNSENL